MNVTINIPDELQRRIKARSAMEERTVREVTTEIYRGWLGEEPSDSGPGPEVDNLETSWLSGWEALGRRIVKELADARTTQQILLDDRR